MELLSGSDNNIKSFISLTDLNLTSKDDLNTYNKLLQLECQRVNLKEQSLEHKEKRFKNKMEKTGIAGIFAASLELTKEGIVKVSQKKIFDKLMIKKT